MENRPQLNIHIPKEALHENCTFTLHMNGWPTDINVFANRLYLADENGVEELPFIWESKQIDAANRFKIWNKYAYKISPNDAHRLAIAAGQNGVISATPRSGYINEKEDILTLLEVDSHDCEWIGRRLISNSSQGAFLSTFPDLPNKPSANITDDFWNQFNMARREPPTTTKLSYQGDSSAIYSWEGGDKIFSLLHGGSILIQYMDEATGPSFQGQNFQTKKVDLSEELSLSKGILAARSGLFGTVIEAGDHLFTLTKDGIDRISTRPVSWRVFPRAKNYLNHLHVVERDRLLIQAYIPQLSVEKADTFGMHIKEEASSFDD